MKRVHIHITGIVQGVGMRPFVYRVATAHGISGWVLNAGDGVHIEATAEERALRAFVRALRDEAPAAARIDGIKVTAPADNTDARALCERSEAGPSGATMPSEQQARRPGSSTFRIVASDDETARTTLVSPDIATCPDCLRELFDPSDRRFHYPFINCTNCGPRFTIIRSLPYDRPATSMDAFPMCDECAAEYADPADRRFHAQPDACFACGPHITWRERPGDGTAGAPRTGATRAESDAIIERCAAMLEGGRIVALKGLGGFHLACNAADEEAVRELRRRKRRSHKPLAVMVRDIEDAQRLCLVDDAERDLLTGSVRPIVLLRRRASDNGDGYVCQNAGSEGEPHNLNEGARGPEDGRHGLCLAPSVAFDLPELGVMLPYTPLQHLLLHACQAHGMSALVMTSGNLSDEPIETDDALAWERLVENGLADALLGNDRAILARYDDSVVRVVNGVARPVRRARGYAPQPLALPALGEDANTPAVQIGTNVNVDSQNGSASAATDAPANIPSAATTINNEILPIPTILACGSEQKATLSLTREQDDGTALCFLSQHIGDIENAETFDAWHEARQRLESLFDLHADALACDLHPQYLASQRARTEARARNLPLIEVQHHHAHIAAGIAEASAHGALDPAQPVIGFAFDGTGFGTDGTIWGGEVLVATLDGYERVGHLMSWRLPGGAAAVRDARRNAYGILARAGLLDHPDAAPFLTRLTSEERAVMSTMVERGLNSPLTSSMGRFLDTVAAITGICAAATYEGEPAIELEAAARRVLDAHNGSWERALASFQQDTEAGLPVRGFTLSEQPAPPADETTAQRQALVGEKPCEQMLAIDPLPVIESVLDACARGTRPDYIALAVHERVAAMALEVARAVRNRTGINDIVLDGGVFMNRLLLERVPALLEHDGFTVHIPCSVPVNDGCIAYGQAAVARARRRHR